MYEALVTDERDNVATALGDLEKGKEVSASFKNLEGIKKIELQQNIPFGHKFALQRIKKGEGVIKYGEVIGKATENIDFGEWTHVHNVESTKGRGDTEN